MSEKSYAFLRRTLPGLAIGLPLLGLTLGAQTVTSDIEGIMYISASQNTDTLVSPAFGRAAVWEGFVSSVAGDTLTLQGSPGWTVNEYAGATTYYVRMKSGSLEGAYFTITANGAGTLTVDDAGYTLSAIAGGDSAEIAPYWTLGTLYPADQVGTGFITSTSTRSRATELMFINQAGTGINRAPSTVYFYYNSAWRKVGSPLTTSFNNTIILPDSYFIQRNKAVSLPGNITTLAVNGRVFTGLIGTIVEGGVARQDNYLAVSFPLDTTLADSGLVADGVISVTTDSDSPVDMVLVYQAGGTGFNRVPLAYYYYNSGWRRVGDDPANDYGTVVLPAGGGFIIRKAAGASTTEWAYDTTL